MLGAITSAHSHLTFLVYSLHTHQVVKSLPHFLDFCNLSSKDHFTVYTIPFIDYLSYRYSFRSVPPTGLHFIFSHLRHLTSSIYLIPFAHPASCSSLISAMMLTMTSTPRHNHYLLSHLTSPAHPLVHQPCSPAPTPVHHWIRLVYPKPTN